MPPELPEPETLATSAVAVIGTSVRDTDYWAHERNFDLRHVEEPVYTKTANNRAATQTVWVRAFDRLPDDPRLHREAMAYICDYTLLEPVLRRHGAVWSDAGLMTASLDHAMWFHADGRADEWIAIVQEAPHFSDDLGSTRATLFTRDGRMLASIAQQGLVRFPRE
jgi:acyl-CoA thioesterase-2